MAQNNKDQDLIFLGPSGSQGKPIADAFVLVDGASVPVRLGAALQSAGSDVNSITAEAPLSADFPTGAVTLSHDVSGVDADEYGDSTHVAVISVDEFGHVTEAESVAIDFPPGGVTSIVAGDNVTIDPTDGLGDVTINAAGQGGSIVTDFANDPDTTTGLDYGYKAGSIRKTEGSTAAFGAGTVTLPDDTNGVIYIDIVNGDITVVAVSGPVTPFGAFRVAEFVTESGAITSSIDVRAFANFFGSYSSQQLLNDLKPTDDGGLVVAFSAALVGSSTGLISVSDDDITVGDDATNFVELSPTGDVVSNTTAFTKGSLPVAQVTTVAGDITGLLDKRPFLVMPDVAPKVVTTQFDKTNSDVLANVPGLTFDVQAAVTYTFEATLFTVSDVSTGVKAAIGGTCTADTIIYEGTIYAAGISVASGATRTTTKGDPVASLTATTVARIDITGTIKVSEPGTLTVQFAENTAVAATVSSVLINSKFSIHRVG